MDSAKLTAFFIDQKYQQKSQQQYQKQQEHQQQVPRSPTNKPLHLIFKHKLNTINFIKLGTCVLFRITAAALTQRGARTLPPPLTIKLFTETRELGSWFRK